MRAHADVARAVNVTLGARGSLAVKGHEQHSAPGYPVSAVDTNGAGDIYAGACLFCWAAGMSPEQAAAFGNFAAANLVQRYGARFRQGGDYQSVLGEFRKVS